MKKLSIIIFSIILSVALAALAISCASTGGTQNGSETQNAQTTENVTSGAQNDVTQSDSAQDVQRELTQDDIAQNEPIQSSQRELTEDSHIADDDSGEQNAQTAQSEMLTVESGDSQNDVSTTEETQDATQSVVTDEPEVIVLGDESDAQDEVAEGDVAQDETAEDGVAQNDIAEEDLTQSGDDYADLAERVDETEIGVESESAISGDDSEEPFVREAEIAGEQGATTEEPQTVQETPTDEAQTQTAQADETQIEQDVPTQEMQVAQSEPTQETQRETQATENRGIPQTAQTNASAAEEAQNVVTDEPEVVVVSGENGAENETRADEESATAIVPSRSVSIDRNAILDVVYPGSGWIYLGEMDGAKNLTFVGRKLGNADTSFSLRARNAGTSILHFYKNDALTGNYIDDYLEVIISNNTTTTTAHVTAPAYAEVVPTRSASTASGGVTPTGESAAPQENQTQRNQTQNAGSAGEMQTNSTQASAQTTGTNSAQATDVQTTRIGNTQTLPQTASANSVQTTNAASAQTPPQSAGTSGAQTTDAAQTTSADSAQTTQTETESSTAASSPYISDAERALGADDLLKRAQDAYDAGEYEHALALLNLFFERATTRMDEGLYLRGQTLEAKSSVQNIKEAVSAYDALTQNWPESALWQNARRRSVYLRRMYIDIR